MFHVCHEADMRSGAFHTILLFISATLIYHPPSPTLPPHSYHTEGRLLKSGVRHGVKVMIQLASRALRVNVVSQRSRSSFRLQPIPSHTLTQQPQLYPRRPFTDLSPLPPHQDQNPLAEVIPKRTARLSLAPRAFLLDPFVIPPLCFHVKLYPRLRANTYTF